MVRRVVLAAMVVVLALGLSGCIVRRVDVGPDRSESRDVEGFEKVSFSGFGTLLITQGSGYELEVSGSSDVLDELRTEVRGDTLYIDWDTPRWTLFRPLNDSELRMELTVPDLSEVDVDGAGEITVDGLETRELEIDLSGACQLWVNDLEAKSLTFELSGAGSAELSGRVSEQRAMISGAGSYNARDLESASTEVEMSGAGSAIVWAEDTLDVEVSGAGSVEYYGSPEVNQNISGLGSVSGRGAR